MFKRIDHGELLTTAPERTIAFCIAVPPSANARMRPMTRPDHARAEIPRWQPIRLRQWYR